MGNKRKWVQKSPFKWLVKTVKKGFVEGSQLDMSNGGSIVDLFGEASGPPVNILCFDGGLPEGVTHHDIFDKLERKIQSPLVSMFDLVAGTSSGGIAALVASLHPESMEAINASDVMLHQVTGACSRTSRMTKFFQKEKKQKDSRATIFKRFFGENMPLQNDSNLKAFTVAAVDKDFVQEGMPEADPYLLRTYEKPKKHPDAPLADGTSAIKMWEAAEATLASSITLAPTEVLVPQGKGDHVKLELCDGGIVANDPTELAIYEAMALFPDRPCGLVLSIGCGYAHDRDVDSSGHSVCKTDIRTTVEAMGGDYVRLSPCVGNGRRLIPRGRARNRIQRKVKKYMSESYDVRRALRLLKQYSRSSQGRDPMDLMAGSIEGTGPAPILNHTKWDSGRSRSRKSSTATSEGSNTESSVDGSSSPIDALQDFKLKRPLLKDADRTIKSSKILYDCIADRSIALIDSFDAAALIKLAQTFTQADHYHAELLESMATRSIAIIETFDAEGLKLLASFYVKMNHSHPLLFARIEIASMAIIDTFDAQSLVGIVSLLAGEDQDRLPDLLDEGLIAA